MNVKPNDKEVSAVPAPADAAPASATSPAASPSPSQDVLLVHGVTEDGKGLAVLRKREDHLELGAVHPLKDGAPIHGEVVRLTPRAECPLVCDVEVCVPPPAPRAKSSDIASRKGPAQVATTQYRDNWDLIWNRGKERDEFVN